MLPAIEHLKHHFAAALLIFEVIVCSLSLFRKPEVSSHFHPILLFVAPFFAIDAACYPGTAG